MLKQNFVKGRMNKDVDVRLLPKGEYRDAFGVEVINSEGSDIGAIEPMLSNKKLTSYDVGANPLDMGNFSDEFRKKIYWFVLSDTGSFLFEWDDINQVQSLVLGDTRDESTRVFSLSKNHLITGVVKVVTQDVDGDLLLFTDDNMQPVCINIERAKSYGINGFEEEDILLIKKPPRYAPKITPTYTNDGSNNIEEKFLLFAYRYRYLDGEYSAPSDFTNYNFNPKPFDLDYFTLDNLGMINSFNAVKIDFNTGEKQVTEIQLLVKESLSNSLNVIETFSKEKNGWGDNLKRSFVFSSNKTITPLPSDQLLRSFDNVPKRAKALSLLENIPVFSNYLEGYNIVGGEGDSININYDVSLQNNLIESGDDFNISFPLPNKSQILNPNNYKLTQGRKIIIDISTNINGLAGYSNSFVYDLEKDFTNLTGAFGDLEFTNLIEIINSDFQARFNELGNYEVPSSYVLQDNPVISYANESGIATFNISPVVFTDLDNNNQIVEVAITFDDATNFAVVDDINSGSCKTNRNYEVGIVYMDKYGRRSTVLTSNNNTLFIPQSYSSFQNKLVANINNRPPYWADRYKLVVKSNPLAYQTVYVTEFYSEDFYTWCKLEGKNKDKVSVGDTLIVKKAGESIVLQPIKVKVLEIKNQEEDFILFNQDDEENDIIESAGLYMKIRPNGFSMNRGDFDIQTRVAPIGVSNLFINNNFPTTSLDLFSSLDGVQIEELAIPAGTSITLKLNSQRYYDNGPKNVRYDNQFFAKRNYDTIEDWFEEVIFKRSTLRADDGSGEFEFDYLPNLSLERSLTDNKLFLVVTGLLSGGSKSRRGRVEAEIIVRIGSGVYVFETLPKQADTEIFYETEQCFDVVDGNHKGTNGNNQNVESGTPAIVEMDFFNCYTQGNGIESFRVRDEFNTNFLSIDTRPTSTSVEEYREIRRFADMTYGKPFIESTNINGLNEFNVSTANFKELDKQYGSVQRTLSREGNLLVLQEEKAGYVLFGKDILNSTSGESILSKVPEVLGSDVPYAGNNGIGKNPESLSVNNFRVNWINTRRGTPIRLSADGTTEINYGMVSYFRNLFIQNPTSRKIGAFDPYFKKYVVSIEDEIAKTLNAFCGNIIRKTITEPFTFVLNLNYLLGETVLDFNVTDGEVNIKADYDNVTYQENSVVGFVNITIPRTDLSKNKIEIIITPVSETATIQVTNTCPVGLPMKVISIVLADESDLGTTMINRYRWGASSFFSEEHLFEDFMLSQFRVEEGLEGTSKFPERGKSVNIQAYKDGSVSGGFYANRENRLGYLISNANYTEADINTILASATFLSTSQTQISLTNFINQASFQFNRPIGNENLYLIWDYQDKKFPPVAIDDSFEVIALTQNDLSVLANDTNVNQDSLQILIMSQPQFGAVEVNLDNTIKYTHTGDTLQQDFFFYRLSDGIFQSENARVTINITANPPVAVDDSLSVNKGQVKNLNVLANDTNPDGRPLTIIIVTQPLYGTLAILPDNTIDYSHDNSENLSDSFTYKLSDGFSESNIATVDVSVGVSCQDGINASGNEGIYEAVIVLGTDTGEAGINYQAFGIPDRFQLEYDGVIVADSKYVGDSLDGDPPSYDGLLGPKSLNVFSYDGSQFNPTGEVREINIEQSDIANGTTEPTSGSGTITFNKTTSTPTTMKLIVTGPTGGTAWNFTGICPTNT